MLKMNVMMLKSVVRNAITKVYKKTIKLSKSTGDSFKPLFTNTDEKNLIFTTLDPENSAD